MDGGRVAADPDPPHPDQGRAGAVPGGAASGLDLVTDTRRVRAALWHRWTQLRDVEARARLFAEFTGFARMLARTAWRRRPDQGLDRGDFQQLAFEGLLQAIDRFDPQGGTPFEGYASRRIRGAMLDGLRRGSDTAAAHAARQSVLSERARSLRAVDAAAAAAGDGTGAGVIPERPPSALDGLSRLVIGLAIGVLAEREVAQIEAASAVDYAAAHYGGTAVRALQRRVLEEARLLDEPGRSIVLQHYVDGIAFGQLAQVYGLSKGRVSQIHRSALERLRQRLRDRGE